MKKILLLNIFLASVFIIQSYAQERTVNGTVLSSEDNSGLPAVNVIVKGTMTGTTTDLDGNYKLTVPANDAVLVFSSIGFATQEIEVGNQSVINLTLVSDVTQLGEVVVTAVGIEREKKAIGYSVQEIEGKQLTQAKEVNIVNSLAGKVAGVQVTNSTGAVGSSSRIVIRGASSFTGNNQPLFVVDGVPLDNSQFSSQDVTNKVGSNGVKSTSADDFEGTTDYGNAVMDINPEDIESLTVLKGPVAAALYGSRAQNGAIIITTKSGKGVQGIGVDFSSSYTFEDPLRLPTFQNLYGQGGYGAVGLGGSTSYLGVDESWGQPLDQGIQVTDYLGRTVPLVSRPNNVENFFETGHTFSNNISLSGSKDNTFFRLSAGRVSQQGIIPNTEFIKTNLGFNGGAQLTDKLEVTASINYSVSDGNNRPGAGYSGSGPVQQLFNWFGRQVDLDELRNYKDEFGNNILNPETGLQRNWNEVYHNSPWWIVLENTNDDRRDRVFGNIKVDYQLADWLTATVRAGTDFYSDSRKQIYAVGTIDPDDMGNGGFYEDEYFVRTTNVDLMLSARKDFGEDFSGSLLLGANRYDFNFKNDYVIVKGLSVPGVYNTANAANPPLNTNSTSEKRINGLYAAAQLGYKNMLFLDLTGRNDWSSTLPKDNRSYFYPSATLSFAFTDAVNIPFIDFGKIRLGYAQVGNDTDPFNLVSYARKPTVDNVEFPFQGAPAFSIANGLANDQLRPEETTSYEAGVDLRFFENRVGIDFTYYNSNTVDQLVRVQVSGASGFTSKIVNAGEIENNGIELMLNVVPIQSTVVWNSTVNFAKNNSEVVAINEGLDNITIGDHFADAALRLNEPYNVIIGTRKLRDANGNVVIGSNGLPLTDAGTHVLGTSAPDFNLGWNNAISYKGINLSFLVDWKKGGDLFSITNWFGHYAGVLEGTVNGDTGHEGEFSQFNGRGEFDADGNLIPGTGVIVNGVLEDGTTNNIEIDAETYFHNYFSARENAVYDASWIKLREVRLGYDLPTSLLGNTPLRSANIALVGRNLWLIHSNIPHIDPEVSTFGASNAQGLETNAIPSVRSFGVSLRVGF